MPYQFYHHAHNVLCDQEIFFLKNLFDTDHMVCATSDGVPPFYAMYILYHVAPVAATTPVLSILSNSEWLIGSDPCVFVAVVKVGKGLLRSAQTQITRLVTIGNGDPDQTKSTMSFSRTGKKYGREW